MKKSSRVRKDLGAEGSRGQGGEDGGYIYSDRKRAVFQFDFTLSTKNLQQGLERMSHEWGYRRIGHAGSITCRAVAQKLETQNEKQTRFQFAPPQIMPNPRSFRTPEDFFMIFLRKSDFVW